MAYIGKEPNQKAVRNRFYYTATGGETSLSSTQITNFAFEDGAYVDVSLNGIALVAGTDYNTTTANTIGGLAALTASDVVEILVYEPFSVFSGNVNGDFTINGDLTVDTDTLHVDSTNDRVGIGTTSPSRALSVDKGTGAGYIAEFKGTNTLSIYDGDTTGIGIGSGVGDNLRLYAGDSFNNSITVATSGNVGIGTASPSNPSGTSLTVYDASTPRINLKNSTTGDTSTAGGEIRVSGNQMSVTNRQNSDLIFGTNNTERMRIDSSGYVGIGNTNPRTPLEIRSQNALGSTFTGATNGEGLRVTQTNYTNGNYVSLVESSYDDGNSSPSVRIGAKFTGSGSHLSFGTSNNYGTGITNEAVSIDTVGNLKFDSGYGSAATAFGNRMWINFNGTGTIAIRDSGNVSSITDNGVGDYNVNINNDMPDANYAAVMYNSAYHGTGGGSFNNHYAGGLNSRTAALMRVQSHNSSGYVDSELFDVAIFR